MAALIFIIFAAMGAAAWSQGNPVMRFGAWPALLGAAGSLSSDEADWLVRGLVVVGVILGILVALKVLRTPPAKIPLETRTVVTFVEEPEFRDFEKYVHANNHLFANELNAMKLSAEERRTEAAEQQAAVMKELRELGDKMDGKRSVSVAQLHQQLKAAELKIVRVESDASTHTQQLASIDTKLTNILQLLPRKGSA